MPVDHLGILCWNRWGGLFWKPLEALEDLLGGLGRERRQRLLEQISPGGSLFLQSLLDPLGSLGCLPLWILFWNASSSRFGIPP